jgi:hypothetical protein
MGDEDERYIVIDGRRWRRSDPALPEERRQELVSELMSARSAVGWAKRKGDKDQMFSRGVVRMPFNTELMPGMNNAVL